MNLFYLIINPCANHDFTLNLQALKQNLFMNENVCIMKKKLFLFFLVCLLSNTILLSQEFKVDNFYYSPINSNEVKLVKKESYWQMTESSISIPEEVTYGGTTYKVAEIEERAFFFGHLEYVSLPKSLKKLGLQAFGANALKEVTCYATNPPTYEESNSAFRPFASLTTLYVPQGAKNAYANSNGWQCADNILEMKDYYITIFYHGEGVNIKQKIELGKTYTFKIEPASGKRTACVLYNNRDVTSSLVDGYFTTPEISDDVTLDVIFLNQ